MPKVLLIGWDAADWKVIHPLIDAGKMPHVQRLLQRGVRGQIATPPPPLSPMLWTSIATGKRPFQHGILGFSEPTPDGRDIQPITNLSRKSKALWNILSQNNLRSVAIGWWPSHPAEPINGVMVSDQYHRPSRPLEEGWPLAADAVHPPELAETLAGLRIHPDLLTPSMVEPFVPLAKEIDQDQDRRLALLLRTLAECMSIQSAASWLMDDQAWDFFAVYYDSIDHFCHGFMRYHPPRQPWVGEREFELYHNVVSQAYQFQDQMLGTLVERAGEDTTVILMSDHGFHPDHLRARTIPDIPAGPAIEHRDFGILAISGPGFKKGAVLRGASVLDIAPTILTIYGLAAGEDMDGKVLSEAFVEAPEVVYIPSWEEVRGADGRHPVYTRLDPAAAHEALEQMIALGYMEKPDENREVAVEKTTRELRYNLGEAYQDDGRHVEAHEIFTALRRADADEQRFAVRLFVCAQALGRYEEMRAIVDDLDGRRRALFEEARAKIAAFEEAARESARQMRETEGGPELPPSPDSLLNEAERRELTRWRNLARYQPAVTDYLKAQVLTAEKRYAEALVVLEGVGEAHLVRPALLLETADLYARLRRWREAEQAYQKALTIDPDNLPAHVGLCRTALRKRQFRSAAQRALDALERNDHDARAHFLLGRALAGMKEYGRAADSIRAAISCNPNFPEAHVRLAALLEQHLGDAESAREHRRLARSMRRGGSGSAAVPSVRPASPETAGSVAAVRTAFDSRKISAEETPSIAESLIVVTGLPRSGTSMVMQMLAAGGVSVLSDGLRRADEDNPRGYLEFQPVKNLPQDSQWLFEALGKAVKIVAPLLAALPHSLPCRVILCQRDLEEVLDSQERMLKRRNHPASLTPDRRRMVKDEYIRILGRLEATLAHHPRTQLLVIEYRHAIFDAFDTAEKVSRFLGGGLDVEKMAAVIDAALYRNRAAPLAPRFISRPPMEVG